ncbi:hypothetical protein ABN034_10560 [Actinopolymorpha sp. B11F2]|uniref:hypothetical protein n=1 Tax=Actinopolymorpha sp. B11F2 TaxID=3160862 RepID=UPI0032E4C43C
MAAFLLLPTGADLTLADVETWVARARALGAADSAPVQVGTPPLAGDDSAEVALSVPVTVSRTIIPGAAPATPEPDAEVADEPEADPEPEAEPEPEVRAAAVGPEAEVKVGSAAEAEPGAPRRPAGRGAPPPAVFGSGSALVS